MPADANDSIRDVENEKNRIGRDGLQFQGLSMFYERISQLAPESTPQDVFPELCRLWTELAQADWVWLWIYNRHTKQWELVCHDSEHLDDLPLPRDILVGRDSVSEFCATNERVVLIDDIKNWSAFESDKTYRVSAGEWMIDHGGEAFWTIPLLSPEPATSPGIPKNASEVDSLRVRGAICIHYKDRRRAAVLERFRSLEMDPDRELLTMGRLSASAIANAYNAQRFSLLCKLNELAGLYLHRVSKRTDRVRSDYLKELTEIIGSTLHVRGVSVFYRVPPEDHIQCLYSTGIMNNAGEIVEERDWADITYTSGERRTGLCFKTGQPQFVGVSDTNNSSAKFIEVAENGMMTIGPALMWPILSAHNSADEQSANKADGVIRCTEHPARFNVGEMRSFDPIEAEMLDFICSQVSPVLHAFQTKVQREHQLSLVKHDLEGIILLIRDSVGVLESDIANNRELSSYAMSDLKGAQGIARNVVGQIDPATAVGQMKPDVQWTWLMGNIVARIKSLLMHLAREMKQMNIRFDGFDEIPMLLIDRTMIERVLFNLIMNAIKYGSKGTIISVNARRGRDGYYVDVSNYGIGISEEDGKHIFKPHYRSVKAKAKSMGLGLGLYIADGYMKKHQGRVDLIAGANPTVFSVFFPEVLQKSWRLH